MEKQRIYLGHLLAATVKGAAEGERTALLLALTAPHLHGLIVSHCARAERECRARHLLLLLGGGQLLLGG